MENTVDLQDLRKRPNPAGREPEVFALHSVILRKQSALRRESEDSIRLTNELVHDLILIDLYSGVSFILEYGSNIEQAQHAELYWEVDEVIKTSDSGEAAYVVPMVFVPRLKLWGTLETYKFRGSLAGFRPTNETRRRSLWFAIHALGGEYDNNYSDEGADSN